MAEVYKTGEITVTGTNVIIVTTRFEAKPREQVRAQVLLEGAKERLQPARIPTTFERIL